MYANDLGAVLWMLHRTHGNWIVFIEPINEHPQNDVEPRVAQLTISNGQVCTCQVRSRVDGHLLLQGNIALHWLENLGHFFYTLQGGIFYHDIRSPIEESLMMLLESIPFCAMRVDKKDLEELPRRQRQVLRLVDGNRTVGQIAAMLHQPLSSINEALSALEARGILRR